MAYDRYLDILQVLRQVSVDCLDEEVAAASIDLYICHICGVQRFSIVDSFAIISTRINTGILVQTRHVKL